jgi:hypothetical protein
MAYKIYKLVILVNFRELFLQDQELSKHNHSSRRRHDGNENLSKLYLLNDKSEIFRLELWTRLLCNIGSGM